jgi:hypothetical protein
LGNPSFLRGGVAVRIGKVFKGVVRFALDWKALFLIRNYGALFDYGWWDSHKRKAAIDGGGRPIPWITYPCLEFVEGRILKKFQVFEYGCGNSTLWWAARTDSVVSCEHDRKWHEKIHRSLPENVKLIHKDLVYGGEYCEVITRFSNNFDVVIIDGRDRVRCAQNSVSALNLDGIIIWDNTERLEYSEGYSYLASKGFKRLDFWGMGPIDMKRWCTSIFYRQDNCLNI